MSKKLFFHVIKIAFACVPGSSLVLIPAQEQPGGMIKTAAAVMSIVTAVFLAARVSMASHKSKRHQP